jgi:hypothetical protein
VVGQLAYEDKATAYMEALMTAQFAAALRLTPTR